MARIEKIMKIPFWGNDNSPGESGKICCVVRFENSMEKKEIESLPENGIFQKRAETRRQYDEGRLQKRQLYIMRQESFRDKNESRLRHINIKILAKSHQQHIIITALGILVGLRLVGTCGV